MDNNWLEEPHYHEHHEGTVYCVLGTKMAETPHEKWYFDQELDELVFACKEIQDKQ